MIGATAEYFGLPEVYIEKDYWLTKALCYLSESPYSSDVVFKGGTSLSKAYRLIDRFSEDVDLAIFFDNKNDSARKKQLKNIERIVSQGLIPHHDERTSKGSKFRKTVYQYPRTIVQHDFGPASSELLIEINAFTNPEPFERKRIATLIAEVLQDNNREDLIQEYQLESFNINVLSVQRTLVEKLLRVIKDSYHEDPIAALSNRMRHLYDITQILKQQEYNYFVGSQEFHQLCEICIKDEQQGLHGNDIVF